MRDRAQSFTRQQIIVFRILSDGRRHSYQDIVYSRADRSAVVRYMVGKGWVDEYVLPHPHGARGPPKLELAITREGVDASRELGVWPASDAEVGGEYLLEDWPDDHNAARARISEAVVWRDSLKPRLPRRICVRCGFSAQHGDLEMTAEQAWAAEGSFFQRFVRTLIGRKTKIMELSLYTRAARRGEGLKVRLWSASDQ